MTVLDLTHTISEDMPVYPGGLSPHLAEGASFEADGFRETLLSLPSHTGTHIDAPAHLLKDGKTLDRFPPEQFFGSALVIDCTRQAPGTSIALSCRDGVRQLADAADFLLFYTGWNKKWGTVDYFSGFPCFSTALSKYLAVSGKKGVGIDAISVDPVGSKLDNHLALLSAGSLVILENLCGLERLGRAPFTLVAAPLKFENADGAPARVFALLD